MQAVTSPSLTSSSHVALPDLSANERGLPLAYLASLMALFAAMVAQRAAYSLGSLAAKVRVHTDTRVYTHINTHVVI